MKADFIDKNSFLFRISKLIKFKDNFDFYSQEIFN